MQDIKIDNFKRDFPALEFPRFESIRGNESELLRQNIAAKLESTSADGRAIVEIIRKRSSLIPDINAEVPSFSFSSMLGALRLDTPAFVLLNWKNFEEVDRMSFDKLNEYFDYIWYPSSDDVEILDGSLCWIISVTHSGDVFFLAL